MPRCMTSMSASLPSCAVGHARTANGSPYPSTPLRITSRVGLRRASGLPIRLVILRYAGKSAAVIMSTDLSLTPQEPAGLFADRFQIEMTFRELKQRFGLGHYQARLPRAALQHGISRRDPALGMTGVSSRRDFPPCTPR